MRDGTSEVVGAQTIVARARRSPLGSAWLAAAIVIAAAAACGPATPTPEAPAVPTAAPPATGAPATPAATAPPDAPSTEAPPAAMAPAMPPAKASTPVRASAFLEDLKKIGIDVTKSPDLAKLSTSQKKKVMPLLQKALGYDSCNGCHVEGDFRAETRDKKISREMWRHFVGGMRDDKGGPIFCDSCHGGDEHILHGDKDAVKAFMESDYEGKLTRADGAENGCTTCHGDTMELHIIEKLWGIPKTAAK